ncbi:hypothetical protein KC332_g13454 [Hortaea werneckii]|nr:hypothetical protein KC358_g13362 [Hortaea werneckii]KAI6808902.1 hypothetical protein KC350_g13140 [Hortaea werneckii]KAI6905283.1 hypothetical protein KC348_g15016 [Hortaea werneckii]KAI6923148.1 hypothetical protein KC341_g14926 [Hortaea werneckii]KAI6959477.1 hypothetical protein KC321_g13397 [Hortaea werneckii]
MNASAVELSAPPEFEDSASDVEYAGEDILMEDVPFSEPTELERSIDEKEVADNDVDVAGLLLGWVEELEYVAEKDDVVLRLKSSKEEGDVEKDADDSGLPLSMGDEVDSSKGTEEEGDRKEDVAEKLGSMLEERKVSTDEEEDEAESEDTGAWLLSTLAELDAEGVVNRSEELPNEPRLDNPEEEDESDDVEIYAVVLLTSTSTVLA